MRVIVTGAKGQLGFDVVECLNSHGVSNVGLDVNSLDLTDFKATERLFLEYMPDVVIHSAAFTDVEKAEIQIDQCKLVNVDVTENIAILCNQINAKLVYISTDYVFSGDNPNAYDVDSPTGPLSVYGQSKLEGERRVINETDKYFIIRTSWAFGINGHNFVDTMLKIGKRQNVVNVVSDQIGSPTHTEDLANLIFEMIKTNNYGIYHATNEGQCSWAEFAVEIFRLADYSTEVNFITSDLYPVKAIRPKNSTMSKDKLDQQGFSRLPHWKLALKRYLNKIRVLPH
ncbi:MULTISPECIES: dTDP-4-dehydrorhamnose reductase [Paenibacillus]|jgi:dTDP-4-dehydrorhamnose reductase|uniref:dTDP-4-dehydrorhamnose reductase n=1 Tax=Paenibacillus TaxID=44249 RepID=UPI00096DDE13|nr:dTDP-4-dehydrorhamnose reductase [Paenibacillus odorifer]OMD97712.1 dTDP-4-dehydrorhamnose reductase [Paenibacillus odorifer]